jgi:hypothetical protein
MNMNGLGFNKPSFKLESSQLANYTTIVKVMSCQHHHSMPSQFTNHNAHHIKFKFQPSIVFQV